MFDSNLVDLTIILPAYNEENNLEKCIDETITTIDSLDYSYEIIVVENGSKDNTFKIAQDLSKKYPNVIPIHIDEATVTGAIRKGFELAKGKIVINLDVDLSTNMSYFKKLVEYTEDFDIVTGSRYLDSTLVSRTRDRLFLSVAFNKILVRGFLRSKLKDNNCGFRAFRRQAGINLYKEVKDNYFFGLVEIMIRAQRNNYKIKEFPVEWKENPRKIGIKRIIQFLTPAIGLWFEFLFKK
jgi:glycosyltransferase AglD